MKRHTHAISGAVIHARIAIGLQNKYFLSAAPDIQAGVIAIIKSPECPDANIFKSTSKSGAKRCKHHPRRRPVRICLYPSAAIR